MSNLFTEHKSVFFFMPYMVLRKHVILEVLKIRSGVLSRKRNALMLNCFVQGANYWYISMF